mmetsp:Transcript_9564/g.17376  ORF Transcript_9564/g.17376 Transcript_9564/m.17376 type:complete len:100 (+) Transcript_9564:472-771(+)
MASQSGSRILTKPGPLRSSDYAFSREQMMTVMSEKKVTLPLSPIVTKMVAHLILVVRSNCSLDILIFSCFLRESNDEKKIKMSPFCVIKCGISICLDVV